MGDSSPLPDRIEQFGDGNPESLGELFNRSKCGIVTDADFQMLIRLVSEPAFLGGEFLTPPAFTAERKEPRAESICHQ